MQKFKMRKNFDHFAISQIANGSSWLHISLFRDLILTSARRMVLSAKLVFIFSCQAFITYRKQVFVLHKQNDESL